MKVRHYCFVIGVLSVLLISYQTPIVTAQSNTKPVLVIFHGVAETRNDLAEMAQASHRMKAFSQVVVIGFNWSSDSVAEAAPRIFGSLNIRFPNSRFILLGSREGGLIAEWIATRVKEAEGKITRVITINSPLDEAAKQNASVTLPSLGPNAGLTSTLKEAPINDLSRTEFVRLWEKDDKIVAQDSALRVLSAGGATTSRLIVRTKPYDPREVFPEILNQAQKDFEGKLYSQVINACEYITKIEPKHALANELIGLSNFNLGQGENNPAKSAELFALGLRQLTTAMEGGRDAYFFGVAHHHSMGNTPGILTFNDVCYGRLALFRDALAFQSLGDDQSHNFLVPLSQVHNLRAEAVGPGRLHVEIGERRKKYNFFSSSVNSSRSFTPLQPGTSIGVTQFSCGANCMSHMDAIYRLIDSAKALPKAAKPDWATLQNGLSWNLVHGAVREKNRHQGVLTVTTTGISWKEQSANADPKHDFEVAHSDLKGFSFFQTSFFLLVKQNKKDKYFALECPLCRQDSDSTIIVAYRVYKLCGFLP